MKQFYTALSKMHKDGLSSAEILAVVYLYEEKAKRLLHNEQTDGWIDTRLATLTEKLGYTPQRWSQVLSALVDKGIIQRGKGSAKLIKETWFHEEDSEEGARSEATAPS